MGVDEIQTDLRVNTVRPITTALRSSAQYGFSAEKSAHKLRAEGLSYRRIATVLRVRYDQVSRWLSGAAPVPLVADVAAPPQPWVSPEKPAATPPPAPDHGEAEAAQTSRINDLMATLRQMSRENREREERLHRLIDVERTAAREQAARRDAELDALRTLVEELRTRVTRFDTEAAPPRRGIWRRGPAR